MVESQNLFQIELDHQTRWTLLPPRLPGEIIKPDPGYKKGAIIKVLVSFFDPYGTLVSEIKSRTGGELQAGSLVEFSYDTKRSKGGLQIDAYDLSPISSDRVTELQSEYENRILEDLSTRLSEPFRQRLAEIERQIEAEVSIRLESRTKEIRQLERELQVERAKLKPREEAIAAKKEDLASREARLQEELERWEREGAAAQRYYERSLEQKITSRQTSIINELDSDSSPDKRWVEKVHERLTSTGFVITPETLNQFLTATLFSMSHGYIVLLAGPPGVGKTSIIEQLAPAIGAGAKVIPVRPAWTDPTDLFGFFNPVHKVYQPTPFIDHIMLARQYQQANRLYFICLDEVNLARIENYAADLLVKLEKSRSGREKIVLYARAIVELLESERRELIRAADHWTPEQAGRLTQIETMQEHYPPELDLPTNMVVLGTVNVDETTYMLSPKVLDRTFVVQFPIADWSMFSEARTMESEEVEISVGWVSQLMNIRLADTVSQEWQRLWEILMNWQKTYLNPLGIECSYRLAADFNRFIKIAYGGLSIEPKLAASDFIQMRILPRLIFTRDEKVSPGQHKIDIFRRWYEDKSIADFQGLDRILQEMDRQSEGHPVLQFWR